MSIGQGVDPSYNPVKDSEFTGLSGSQGGAAKMGEIGQDNPVPTGYSAGVAADSAFISQAASEMQGNGAQKQPVDPSYKQQNQATNAGLG